MVATIATLLFALYFIASSGAQLLSLFAENVTVPYKGTALLSCMATIDSTMLGSNEKVLLTVETIQRNPPLDRPPLNYTLFTENNKHTLTLILEEVLLSDTGVFTCSASASVGSLHESSIVTFTLEIKDYYTLILSVHAPNVTVSYNDPAVLRCTVNANESAVSHTDSDVSISIKKIGSTVDLKDQSEGMFAKVLKLSNALVEDAALYQCTVTIGEEEANKLFMLSLNDSVEIVESLDSISKSLGEEMTLKCRFKPPAVTVHWERNQVVLEQDEATIITSNGNSTLYVNKLNFYHMAEYRCIGTFFSSVGEAATTVAIKEYVSPHVTPGYEMNINSLNSPMVECDVYGVPTPLYRWKKSNHAEYISSSLNDNGVYVDNIGRLNLFNALEEASGVYVCYGMDNITGVSVTANYNITITERLSSSPIPSPTQTSTPGNGANSQLLFIMIILAVVIVTAIVLFAVVCYFFAANLELCYNKDKMRMDRMEKKMKRQMKNEKMRSLYDQEFGPYAHNEAYGIEWNEEEMQQMMEERTDDEVEGYNDQRKEKDTAQIKKSLWKGKHLQVKSKSFNVNQEMNRHQRWQEEHYEDNEQRESKLRQPLRHGPSSSQTMETDVDEEEFSDKSDTEYELEETPEVDIQYFQVPTVVFQPNKSGKIRKSSLRLPSDHRPRMKKRVSIGSVEIVDDEEGKHPVAKKVDFNDEGNSTEKRDPKKKETFLKKKQELDSKEYWPESRKKEGLFFQKKKNQNLKQMGDVMNYLDEISKAQREEIKKDTTEVVPKKKMSRKPTPYPSKEERDTFLSESTYNDEPRRRSQSLDLPRQHAHSLDLPGTSGGGVFGKRSKKSSKGISKKKEEPTRKESKRSEKRSRSSMYGDGNADVFY